jgi:NitT/TauT family transport system substrate-binding protein
MTALSVIRTVLAPAIAGMLLSSTALAQNPASPGGTASKGADVPAASRPLDILIDWQAEPTYLGIYFAKDQGYFSALGYNATITQSWGANQAVAAIAAGRYLIGTASGGATVLGYNNGADVVSLGVLYQKIPTVIYGRAGEKIAKPSDLKGKRIGIYPGSITSNEFDAFLKLNGLTRDDVRVVSLSGADIPLLLAHQVDAVLHYTEMSPVQVETSNSIPPGDRKTFELRLSDFGVGGYGLNIITGQNTWKTQKDDLVAITKAIEQGYKVGCERRNDAVRAFIKEFPDKNPEYVKISWNKVCTLIGSQIGDQSTEGWQQTIDLYRSLGLLKAPVTPAQILGH